MKKILSLFAAMLMASSLFAGELTVADGTVTNEYSPFYGWNADTKDMQCQTLYLKEDLTDLVGGAISAIKFYSTSESVSWAADGAEFEVSLAEVDESDFSNGLITPEFTSVYTGLIAIENSELNIVFTEAFPYSGEKNLLFEIKVNGKGKYAKALFYGVSPDEQLSIMAYPGWSGTLQTTKSYFTPKTTFTYEAQTATCPRPSKLSAVATPDGAVLTWHAEEGAQHQVCVVEKDAEAESWELLAADVLTYTAKGLKAGTAYDFYVRTYCSETEQSTAAKLSFTPECKAPATIEISDLTHESATFTWSKVAGVEKYQFVLVLANTTPDWNEVEAKEVLSVSVDTLQSNTSYDFYVRSWFNAETQSEATKLSFTTNCIAEGLPYSENFSSTNLPDCWNTAYWGSSYNYWSIDTYYSHSTDDSYSLKYNARNGSTSDIQTTSVELTEDAVLGFFYQNRYVNYGQSSAIQFEVIVLDASNESELVNESITTYSDDWAEQTIDLSAFTGKTIKVRFRGHGINGTTAYLRIDDINITYKPCAAPTELAAEATADGANIAWASEEGISWNLRYREKDAEPAAEWTVVEGLTEKSKTLEGLTVGTTYEVQVQTIASANRVSEWSASVVFTPITCANVTKVVFAGSTYNSVEVAWTTEGAGTWDLRYKEAEGEWTTVNDLAETYYNITGLTTNAVYTVQVKAVCGDADSWVAAEKTFTPVYSAPVSAEAEDITDQGATVQWLRPSDVEKCEYDFVIPGEAAAWKETTELFATADNLLAGTDYLFVVRSKYPTGVSEADTTEFATITIAPKNLAQEGVSTTSSATFTWEANGAATQYQWRVDDGEWSEAQTALTATAEELTAGASHTFYVRSFYSESVQSAAITLAFQTACAEKEIGFLESFESGVPTCWESTGSWGTTTEFFRRGNALRINARSASGSLTTPTVNIAKENAVLIFFHRTVYGSNNDFVNAKVIITPEGEEATEIAFSNSANLTKQVVDLSAFNGKKVTIQFSIPNTGASSSAWVYIDEVQVVEACEAPTNLVVEVVDASATITWTAGSGTQDLRYKASTADKWITIEDATSPVELNELEISTLYEVQVRSFCSEDNFSDWSSTTFTTGGSTGVSTVETHTHAIKRIENGQLVIIKNDVKFNVIGTIIK